MPSRCYGDGWQAYGRGGSPCNPPCGVRARRPPTDPVLKMPWGQAASAVPETESGTVDVVWTSTSSGFTSDNLTSKTVWLAVLFTMSFGSKLKSSLYEKTIKRMLLRTL